MNWWNTGFITISLLKGWYFHIQVPAFRISSDDVYLMLPTVIRFTRDADVVTCGFSILGIGCSVSKDLNA